MTNLGSTPVRESFARSSLANSDAVRDKIMAIKKSCAQKKSVVSPKKVETIEIVETPKQAISKSHIVGKEDTKL